MNNAIRITLGGLLLIGIVLLARNGIASAAAGLAGSNADLLQGQNQAGDLSGDARHGTVRPPDSAVEPVQAPGTYSAGGICTLKVAQLTNDVSLHTFLLPFFSLGKHPQDVGRYLAGVCQVIYTQAGKTLTDLVPSDGSAQICFAALPNTSSTIYVYDGKTWTPVATTVSNGLACADASETGKYVLAANQP